MSPVMGGGPNYMGGIPSGLSSAKRMGPDWLEEQGHLKVPTPQGSLVQGLSALQDELAGLQGDIMGLYDMLQPVLQGNPVGPSSGEEATMPSPSSALTGRVSDLRRHVSGLRGMVQLIGRSLDL